MTDHTPGPCGWVGRLLCRLGLHSREYDFSNCGMHGWSDCARGCGR